MKPRRRSQRSLVVLVQALVGETIVADLRNETSVRGRVDEVDEKMNIRFSNVILTPFLRPPEHHTRLFVTGRQLVYIHIPDKFDCVQLLRDREERVQMARVAYARKKKKAPVVP